jgi:hypothetical protein
MPGMSREAVRALEAQLGHDVPKGIRTLSAEDLSDLTAALRDARHRQAAALQEAGDRALSRIPWLRRAPIRRIVG